MAGPYRVTERKFTGAGNRAITLRTLLHEEVADLGAGYLDATERYLRLYEDWIGPYPYGSFSIVSSPTPTGFGMPTLTYLGIDVLRLPFIRDTSLGHEVLHNWWGNGVYPDYATGNWSEGLTTFMADHAYREQAGPAAARGTAPRLAARPRCARRRTGPAAARVHVAHARQRPGRRLSQGRDAVRDAA